MEEIELSVSPPAQQGVHQDQEVVHQDQEVVHQDQSPSKTNPPSESRSRRWIRRLGWRILAFFITLIVFLIGFPSEASKVWTLSLVNLGLTLVLYLGYRVAVQRIKWGMNE